MGGERDLEIRLLLSDKEALSRLHAALGQVEAESKKTSSAMNLGWANAAAAFYLVSNAIQPVIGFMREAINASAAQEDAVNRLNVSLRNQGIFSETLSQSFQQMAASLQSSTRFSDEAIMKVEQRLISIGNIAPDQVGRVTKAILDFSTATGKDIEASTMAFVQAANGKTTALGKFGLAIDASVPKSQKLDEALRLVEQRFGGAAQADINTYSGAIANFHNSWDDFLEVIGDFIVKNPSVVEGLHLTKGAVEQLTSFLKDHKQDVTDFISSFTAGGSTGAFASIGTSIMESVKGMGAALGGVAGAAGSIFSGGPSLIEQIVGTPDQAQTASDTISQVANNTLQQKLSLEEQLSAIHQSFNESDFQKDLLNNERKIEAQRQLLLAWYDEKSATQMARQQQEDEMLSFALDAQKKAHESLWSVAGKARDTFSSGMSSMLINLMKGTGSVKEAFVELGWQMIKILLDYAIQLAINMAISKAMQAANLAATIPIATATASAWAPAAALVSLATFGANAAGAAAALVSTTALAQGLALLSAVPGLAEGGTITSGGSVLVGEHGPEFLNLPQGASVIPLQNGGRAGTTIYINVEINNPVISSREIADDIAVMIASKVSEIIDVERERL